MSLQGSRALSLKHSAASAALLLLVSTAQAIEAPKPAAQPSEPAAPPPAVEIAPTDETAFYTKLQRVTQYRNFRGLGIAAELVDQLGQAQADLAVAALNASASNGSADANVALVRVQHWCSSAASHRPADVQAQISKLGADFPANRAARIAGVLRAEAEYMSRARASCGKAPFDYRSIEARLREAAAAGHPASATELAQFTRDPAQREALLKKAADKHYAPAMYVSATQLLIAVQRGQTTENVSAIRELLKQAGRSCPRRSWISPTAWLSAATVIRRMR